MGLYRVIENQQQTSSLIRYNLELEIIPGFLYNFSLNYVFDQISDSIGTLVETIMVYNYSGSFIFKMKISHILKIYGLKIVILNSILIYHQQ